MQECNYDLSCINLGYINSLIDHNELIVLAFLEKENYYKTTTSILRYSFVLEQIEHILDTSYVYLPVENDLNYI